MHVLINIGVILFYVIASILIIFLMSRRDSKNIKKQFPDKKP